MHRLLIVLFLMSLAMPGHAQESEELSPDPADGSATEAAGIEDDADEELDDEDDLDVLYDEEDDDAFIPSENVKFGQSIPFPTDI